MVKSMAMTMVKSMVNHGQPWLRVWSAMVKSMVYHGQPWSKVIANYGQKPGLSWSKAWLIMVINGQQYG